MRRREGMLLLVGAATLLLALLTVFAIELSGSLSKSRGDIERTFRQRATLASALTSSIFQSSSAQGAAQNAKRYGGPVTTAALDRAAVSGQSAFLAVLDQQGRIIAASSGITPAARRQLAGSPPLLKSLTPAGSTALGDVLPLGKRGAKVIEYAQSFPVDATGKTTRTLVTGFSPALISRFLSGYLVKTTNVAQGHAYVLDSRGSVVGGTVRATRPGQPVAEPGLASAVEAGRQGSFTGHHWFASAQVAGSSWRVVLTAEESRLFASVTGARKWVPWLVFAALGFVACGALLLGRRLLRASEEITHANARLELSNDELEATNASLERRAAELQRSNAELEQFASIASHDLQEPLRKVRTFTDQLAVMEAEHLSPKGQDYLTRTSNAAERMQNLIDDLLKFSRVATHGRPFAPVDLGQIAREVASDLETTITEAGASVHIGELPTVNADAFQIRQLLQNLLSNAVKFRTEGVPPEVWIDGDVSTDTVDIVVRDNGIGFDPQYSTRIFNIFERLHGRSVYAGTGIGLALVRKIAERHGGTVTAESRLGEGATFVVTLPMHQSEEAITTRSYLRDEDAAEVAHV